MRIRLAYAFPMYAIYHLHHESGTWYWAVSFSRRGKHQYKRFHEPKYGGSANALKAAAAWLDEHLAAARLLTMVEFCRQIRSNNTSKVAGVHLLKSVRQPHGFWRAKLKLGGGKYQSKNFSVLKHGPAAAYKLAVAARPAMLSDAKDNPYLYDRVAKRLTLKSVNQVIFPWMPTDRGCCNRTFIDSLTCS